MSLLKMNITTYTVHFYDFYGFGEVGDITQLTVTQNLAKLESNLDSSSNTSPKPSTLGPGPADKLIPG
jgi:hypothetical protein